MSEVGERPTEERKVILKPRLSYHFERLLRYIRIYTSVYSIKSDSYAPPTTTSACDYNGAEL